MKKQLSTYQKAQVAGASQQELILMCYRGAIQYLREAESKLEAGEVDKFSELLEKAHRVVFHLYTTLDMEKGGEIADKLAELYSYIINQFYLLNATKKADIFNGVVRILENLKEGWEQIGQENSEIASSEQEDQGIQSDDDNSESAAEKNVRERAGAHSASVSVQI